MVIKVYISGISASTEIKSYQQRAQFVLGSLKVDYESIDITDPEHEEAKEMIKAKCKQRDGKLPRTPQFFNDDIYCGDWFDFEIASDEDRILEWLGLELEKEEEEPETEQTNIVSSQEIKGNDFDSNNVEPKTEKKIVKTEEIDGDIIVTEETVVTEEIILFGKQNFKTGQNFIESLDNNKNNIDFENEINFKKNKELEEEICLLDENKEEENLFDKEDQNNIVDQNDIKKDVETKENNNNEISNKKTENVLKENKINEDNEDKVNTKSKESEIDKSSNHEENLKEDENDKINEELNEEKEIEKVDE